MSGPLSQQTGSAYGRALAAVRRLSRLARNDDGALLIETVIAVLVFAVVGTAVVAGLSTTHISGADTERQSTAENITRGQMEYVFSLPYQDPPSSYPTISVPPGYGVTATAEEYVIGDPNIEKVVVTTTYESAQLMVLETLRTK